MSERRPWRTPKTLREEIPTKFPDNTNGAITEAKLREFLEDLTVNFEDKPYIDIANYGGVGDAREYIDGAISSGVVTTSKYTFTEADIGKSFCIYRGWNAGDYDGATIVDVTPEGGAVLDNDYGGLSASSRRILFGTDNTQAFEDAFEAARDLIDHEPGLGNDIVAWRAIPAGGCVMLRHGTYLVKNTQARVDAGKEGAINVPRNCSLLGQGMGSSNIVAHFGNIGHIIANESSASNAATQRVTLGNFSVFGGRGGTGEQSLDNIHWSTRMGNYSNTDAFNTFFNIQSHQARQHGFYFKGRGENLFYGLWAAQTEGYGYFMDGIQDSRWSECNAAGCRLTGMRIKANASSAFNNCKSFYCGDGGGTDYADSANWYISGDSHSYRKGSMIFTGCESQESRGSGWVIEGGLCQFVGCLSSDPDRFGGGTRPDIKAGIHLRADGSNNVFDGFYVRASLGLDWTNESHYGGDYAVYIDRNSMANPGDSNYERRGPRNNKGSIYTLEPSRYNEQKIGGPGAENGMNCMLSIDGVYLNAPLPEAVTDISARMNDTQDCEISFTLPDTTDVLPIDEVKLEYRLQSETDDDYVVFDTESSLVSETIMIPSGTLTVDEDYRFRITTHNREGYGLSSATHDFTFSAAVPDQVTGLSAIADDGEIALSWSAPNTNGSAITDYTVEYSSDDGGNWSTFADGTSTNTTATVTGLTNDTEYLFRVSAVNGVGTGTASSTLAATPTTMAGIFADANLVGFWDGDASTKTLDGDDITNWAPFSGSAGDMTVSAGSAAPHVGTLNSLDVIDFDGSDDVINAPVEFQNLRIAENNTIIIMFALDSPVSSGQQAVIAANGDQFLFYVRGSSSGNDFVTKQKGDDVEIEQAPQAATYIAVIRRDGATLTLDLNGDYTASGATESHTSVDEVRFGRVNQYFGYLDGKIAAIVAYDKTLSDAEVNSRCNFLATRYAGTWTDL